MELVNLKEVLMYVIYGGAGAVVQRFLEWLSATWPAFDNWPGESKRYLAFVLDVVVATGCFGIAVAFGYLEAPVTLKAWLETLFAIGFLAITTQQVVHARRFKSK